MKSVRFFDPKKEINFVKYFKPMLVVAALIPLTAVIGGAFGINWGIDFQGGTEMQVLFEKDLSTEEITDVLSKAGFEKHQVQRFGAAGSTERLIRVERLETFKAADIERIRALVSEAFPAIGKIEAQVRFNPEIGDRLTVLLPEPKVEVASDEISEKTALSAQRSSLAHILDTKSGFKLRRTKDLNGELSTLGAVKPDDSKNGLVEYNVLFTGTSDIITDALSARFGTVDLNCTPQSKSCVRAASFVDSTVSGQLRNEGALAILIALIAILIYISIRFDFFFAPGAIVALVQDTFGAFLVFVFLRYEFDLPSVAAMLTVLGVSINNTIVVYDRIRETVPSPGGKKQADDKDVTAAVNKAINDTLSRTINTTLTVVIASVALWWFAGGVIASFAMVLIVGLSLGALSGTFAAPATYLFMRRQFGHLGEVVSETSKGKSREEKARGVV